jgi:hypothetical protein
LRSNFFLKKKKKEKQCIIWDKAKQNGVLIEILQFAMIKQTLEFSYGVFASILFVGLSLPDCPNPNTHGAVYTRLAYTERRMLPILCCGCSSASSPETPVDCCAQCLVHSSSWAHLEFSMRPHSRKW